MRRPAARRRAGARLEPSRCAGTAPPAGRAVLDAAGAAALGYLVLSFAQVHDYDLALFHGGYLGWRCSPPSSSPRSPTRRRASAGCSRSGRCVWLGLRSYSFYLWHWPVLALTRPGIDVSMPRGILIPLQLVAVLALSELSYRFVEIPFRGRAEPSERPTDWLRYGRPALLAGVLAIVFAIGWSGIVASGGRDLAAGATAASTAEFAQVRVKPVEHQPTKPPRIVAFGDSVMIGAKQRLAARLGRRFSMNARVSRQADEFVDLVDRLRARAATSTRSSSTWGTTGPSTATKWRRCAKRSGESERSSWSMTWPRCRGAASQTQSSRKRRGPGPTRR